ncbi:hypothetical protein F2Q69_00050208 [Brassica cretica]|uniref:Uncharacterized protein n=1 Tax=Brassica cretica TaxID=69181 RepID=A0A8S9PL65_BRACR|nr:hypothetical protein F2Q69_00050208 [Brassica cretica]
MTSQTYHFSITEGTKRIAVGRSDEHSPEGGSKRLQRRRLATAPGHHMRKMPIKLAFS